MPRMTGATRLRVLSHQLCAKPAAEGPPSLGGVPVVSPSAVGLDAGHLEELKASVHGNVDTGKWPHAVTLVARRGQIWYGASSRP